MPPTTQEAVEGLIAAFERRDLEAVLAFFAEEAVLYDPHYPVPEMRGKAAIRRGFEWAFGNLERPGFTVRRLWAAGDSGAVELETHHVFKGGMELKIPQVFVFETRAGLITRLQAYVPYGPPGVGGWLAKLVRLVWRLQGRV